MALKKAQKQKIIGDLKDKISRQKSMVFALIAGVKVKDLSKLRKDMKNGDCELKVAKKTLILLALRDNKIEIDHQELSGEVAVGFGYLDEMKPFKILHEFSKENEKFQILGGLMAGKFIKKQEAVALAILPSREELLAKLFYVPRIPIFGLFNMLQTNLNILKAIKVEK